MYIILIGYLYVVMMFVAVSGSISKGLVIFFIFAFLPTMILLWLKRGKQIVKRRKQEDAIEDAQKYGAVDSAQEQNDAGQSTGSGSGPKD